MTELLHASHRRHSRGLLTLIVAIGIVNVACGGRTAVRTTASDPTAVDVSQLWQEPADLASRDLFAGPSVAGVAVPGAGASFTFLKADRTGYSPGYDVRDASGVEWSIKLGKEAQTEVVSSRILWAIGYHQIPTYYVTTWTMTGGGAANPGPGRFRPTPPGHKAVADWAWTENDFAQTQPFKGLVVANMILNNWDWKTSNNKVYDVAGRDGGPSRIYVVRDLGASLGKTSAPALTRWLGSRMAQGSRNEIEDFESQGFILGASGDRVDFDYRGIYKGVVASVTPADVVWASRLMSRLSDAQWNDAFRAGGYPPDIASRYIAKLKAKIAEGIALTRANTAE
jgi:hypothetical protein